MLNQSAFFKKIFEAFLILTFMTVLTHSKADDCHQLLASFEKIIIDKSYSDADLFIVAGEILTFQKKFIADRNLQNSDHGFLISSFTVEELIRLVKDDSRIYLILKEKRIVGYVLMSGITEFSDLINQTGAIFSRLKEFQLIANSGSSIRYLYQIAVNRTSLPKEISSVFLNYVLGEESAHFILADVLTHPLNNVRSIKFFQKNGFDSFGVLDLDHYRDFGNLKSAVLLWER